MSLTDVVYIGAEIFDWQTVVASDCIKTQHNSAGSYCQSYVLPPNRNITKLYSFLAIQGNIKNQFLLNI